MTSAPQTARYEVWKQEYSTETTDEWHLHASVAHRDLADAIVESGKGWGTRWKIRGDKKPETPEWADLPLAEFQKRYALIGGTVYPLDDPWVREYVAQESADRARAEEARRVYLAAQALPTRQGHPKGRIP